MRFFKFKIISMGKNPKRKNSLPLQRSKTDEGKKTRKRRGKMEGRRKKSGQGRKKEKGRGRMII